MANEKRLVNAEAIARKLKMVYCAECNIVRQIQCSACWVNDVLELLDGDSVEAVEVVHGHWTTLYKVDTWMGTSTIDCFICSECGVSSKCKGNYCPNCGAKMDGGNEDVNV